MNNKIELLLSEGAVEEIAQHAQETFPEECCGVILTDGTVDRVHRLKNIQNQLHALDPQTYPRTAIIAIVPLFAIGAALLCFVDERASLAALRATAEHTPKLPDGT